MLNLWPDDIAPSVPNPNLPVIIVREQASLLGKKTNNLIEAEVMQVVDPEKFIYNFLIVAPVLNSYKYRLFTILHHISPYPVVFDIDKEVCEELDLGKSEYMAQSEIEFIEILRAVLHTKKTQEVIGTLLSMSK